MNSIRKIKDEIRAEYSARRSSMDPVEKKRRDDAICRAATSLASFRYAEYVLLYAATENEIQVQAIAEEALARGKKIAFPRCDKEAHTMQYHLVSSLDELARDSYGILEPPPSNPIYDPENDLGSAVCFVPGLVYDKAGYRLGYGKGFYDRFLNNFPGLSVGVTFSELLSDNLPADIHDVPVNAIITDKESVRIK